MNSAKLREIMQRSAMDYAFRRRLLADPEQVLKENDIAIPPNQKVIIVENADEVLHVALPPLQQDAASEDEEARARFQIANGRGFLYGRLDTLGVQQVRDALLMWMNTVDSAAGAAFLDVGDIDYISSAGIALLLVLLKTATAKSVELRLLRVQETVRNVFALSGMDQTFGI